MKKFLRLASVFTVIGATLMLAGCSKDYTEDIQKVQNQLNELRTGTIATQDQQIKALQATAASLQATDEALKKSIKDVEDALAAAKKELQDELAKKGSELAVNELQSRVSALESARLTLEGRCASIEKTIEDVKATMSSNMSYINATFATQNALNKVSSELGALAAAVESYKATLESVDSALASNIAAVKTTADDALAKAKNALGQIENIWNNFDNYYTKSEIDGKVNALNADIAQVRADLGKAIAKEAQDVKDLQAYDALLKKSIEAEEAARIAAVADEAKLRETADKDLEAALKVEEAARIAADAAEAKARELADAAEADAREAADAAEAKTREEAIAAEAKAREEAIAAEAAARQAADDILAARLADSIAAERNLRIAADALLDAAIKAEASTRELEDAVLNGRIDNEEKLREAQDKVLEDLLKKEEAARLSGDDELGKLIATETEVRTSQITYAQNERDRIEAAYKAAIEAEAALARAAEKANADAIAAEVKARQDAISAEADTRKKADDELQNQITLIMEFLGTDHGFDSLAVKTVSQKLSTIVNVDIPALKDADVELGKAIDAVKDSLNKEISLRVKQVEALEKADKELSKKIDDEIEKVSKNISDLQKELEGEIDDLWAAINNITDVDMKQVSDDLKSINGKIDAIAGRVVTISVMPSLNDELVHFSVGDTTASMFYARFKFEPAVPENIELSNLVINYGFGRTRGAHNTMVSRWMEEGCAEVVAIEPDTLDAKCIYVLAKAGKFLKQNHNYAAHDYSYFFSLSYAGEDAASEYVVSSDYTEVLERNQIVGLEKYFRLAKADSLIELRHLSGEYYGGFVDDTKEYIYTEVPETVSPFTECSVVFATDDFGGMFTNYISLSEFTDFTGINVVASGSSHVVPPMHLVKADNLDSIFDFADGGDSLYVYADSTYAVQYFLDVNNATTNNRFIQNYTLTKKNHDPASLSTTIYWNYITWKDSERTSVLDTANVAWREAKAHGCTGTVPTFAGANGSVFSMDENLVIAGISLPAADTTFTDKYIKSNKSDKYIFNLSINFTKKAEDAVIVKDLGTVSGISISGGVSESNAIAAALVDETFTAKNLKDYTAGLTGDDAKLDMLKHAFWQRVQAFEIVSLKENGVDVNIAFNPSNALDTATNDIIFTCTGNLVEGNFKDNTKLSYARPGLLKYGKSYELGLRTTVFGVTYLYTVKFKVADAPFNLATKPLIVDGVGTVNGKFNSPDYTIEDLNYYNQVEVVGDMSKESTTDIKVAFSCAYEESGLGSAILDGMSGESANVSVIKSNGQLDQLSKMNWNTYTGLEISMKAVLLVDGVAVQDTVEYKLKTRVPVQVKQMANLTATKNSGWDQTINIARGTGTGITGNGTIVYGMRNGSFDNKEDILDGFGHIMSGYRSAYEPCDFVYDFAAMKVTINGVEATLYDGTDYTFDASTSQMKFLGENLSGQYIIKIPAKLNHKFDYYKGEKHTKPVTKDMYGNDLYVTLTLNF